MSLIFNHVGTIGGIFLIFGAIALYKGRLDYSVLMYFIADCMWAFLAYNQGDIFGLISILIGMTLGVLVYAKTQLGIFHKNLNKD